MFKLITVLAKLAEPLIVAWLDYLNNRDVKRKYKEKENETSDLIDRGNRRELIRVLKAKAERAAFDGK